jgi:polyphosphate kinase
MMMNFKEPNYYINRELSWLRFNTRVLEEAMNSSKPLLERLKFLAIYGSNLDEFYMIRVAGLKEIYDAGIVEIGPDRLTPKEQLSRIRDYLYKEKASIQSSAQSIFSDLREYGIYLSNYQELNEEQKQTVDTYFFSNLYPVIVPIAVDSTHPFPHLNNLSFAMVLKLKDTHTGEEKYGLIRIPRVLPRFIEIGNTYVPIEYVIERHIDELFKGYELIYSSVFRVTRNADMDIEEEEADDFMQLLEEGLRRRKKGKIVRIEIADNANDDLLDFLQKHIDINARDIYRYEIPINLSSFWQIVSNDSVSGLVESTYTPKSLPPFDSNESIFDVLDEKSVLLYHPYESFDPVVKFITEAARDPDVLSIRMTLYRVGSNSPIVKALIDAVRDGKQVTAMVELKARFDEENNLIWAKALEEAGAHVVFGIPGFKVHSKIAQVIKKSGNKLKQYIHLGTGNYNPSTARIYTDISYFSSDTNFVDDGTRFFHFLTGFSKGGKLNKLYMAPTQIKPSILELIENEKKLGENGRIIAKMNSLVDQDVIIALYKASIAGVKIDLIIRGICCLRPQVKGLSENIRVVSIVGKYLEHARIFYFKNAIPSSFISSADWMPRNLERRVELMTPVIEENLAQKLYEILTIQLKDNVLARELQASGEYKKLSSEAKTPLNSQTRIEEYYKSLSKLHDINHQKIKKFVNRFLKEG